MKFRVHFNSERQQVSNNKLFLVLLLLLLLQLSTLKSFVSASIKEIQYLHKNGTIITIDWPTAMGYSSQEEYDDWTRRRRASLHLDGSSFHYDDDYTHHDTTSDSDFDNDDRNNNDTGKEETTTAATTTTTTNNRRKLAPADCGPPENRFLATAITHLIGTSGTISNIGEEAAFISAFKTALSASSLCIRADEVIVRDQDLTELRRLDEEDGDDKDDDEPGEEEEQQEMTDFERFLKEEERQKHRKLRYWKLSVTVRVYGVCSRCDEMKSLSSDATRRGRRHLVRQGKELQGAGTDDDHHHYYRKLVVDYSEQEQQEQHQEEEEEEEPSSSEDLVLDESLRRRLMNDEIEFVFRLELINSGYEVFECIVETQLTDFYCIRIGPLTAFIAEFTLL